MAPQAKASAQHSLAPQPKHSMEFNKSEFEIWSAKAMQEMENILQVPKGVDHLTPPLLDLDNIYMIISLGEDSVARKEEPLKLLNKTKPVGHPSTGKETAIETSNKNQSKDQNNLKDSSSGREKPAEVLIGREVAEIKKPADKTDKYSPTSCKLCDESRFHSKFSMYLHKHLKHNQFQCLNCDSSFKNVSQLADHLKIVHKIKEKSQPSTDVQSVFICTECSAIVHALDLESHSRDCNAKPFFPLQGYNSTDFEASETLLQGLNADENQIQHQIFIIQTHVDRLNGRKKSLASEHQKLISSREFQQWKSMKTLIGKLKARKHRLSQSIPNLKEGYERNYRKKHLEKVCMQLRDVQKAYLKTEKNWHKILKQVSTLKTQILFLERESTKKTLVMGKLNKRLFKN